MPFERINIRDIKESPVKRIADDWALLSAGTAEQWNAMTVSWGGIGEIWGFDAAFVFVRPQRYTKEFIDASPYFTLSFFGERKGAAQEILSLCGKKSGRDCDKMAEAGLTPQCEGAAVWPKEAELALICRKAAAQVLDPKGFIDARIAGNYSDRDYHTMYVGEILRVCQKT
ncbi:MAG: flavin reductase [Oscillospiraceae bacterium]|jgi:flavin reductase (DIM6/NTAB) family NADH-FMN oxidoreductase RutF|nr:flavin reductase [Oscillospiraceae bacterium]